MSNPSNFRALFRRLSVSVPSDYQIALSSYREKALAYPEVISILQCGTVTNPGVSDIDTLLLIKDWPAFHPSLDLLNPERISKLFAHGPFICESAFFSDLMYFTTLRVLNSPENELYEESDNCRADPFAILIRQSMCIAHFSKQLSCRYPLRQKLLLLKSFCYSLSEVAELVAANLNFSQRVEAFNKTLLTCIQQAGMINFHADEDFHNLFYSINKSANALVNEAIVFLSKYLVDTVFEKCYATTYGLKNPADIINEFSDLAFFDGDMLVESVAREYVSVANRWVRFHENIRNGYLRSGSLWKGAEYLFIQRNPYALLGKKIWLRRFVKKTNFLFSEV